MKLDRYDIFARLIPALLTGIPFYVLYFFLLRPSLGDFLEGLFSLKFASDITVGAALTFLSIQINRFVSKEVFERRMFKDGLYLPTTTYLMHSDKGLSSQMTARVHRKIKADFRISIPSLHEEKTGECRSRQLIMESVSLIKAKIGKGKLLHQHNIEYGFVRNLVGGAIPATATSLVLSAVFLWAYPNRGAASVSICLVVLYAIIVLLGRLLIRTYGAYYCRVLIREYLAL